MMPNSQTSTRADRAGKNPCDRAQLTSRDTSNYFFYNFRRSAFFCLALFNQAVRSSYGWSVFALVRVRSVTMMQKVSQTAAAA
jgi:hypothetical protein